MIEPFLPAMGDMATDTLTSRPSLRRRTVSKCSTLSPMSGTLDPDQIRELTVVTTARRLRRIAPKRFEIWILSGCCLCKSYGANLGGYATVVRCRSNARFWSWMMSQPYSLSSQPF